MEEALGLEIYTWDKEEGHEKVSVEENALSHLEPEEETGAAVWRMSGLSSMEVGPNSRRIRTDD